MSETFADKLNSLVSLEISRGTFNNPEKMADMVEKLASSLAFTAALASGGDPGRTSHLLEGMVAYIYETATERAPLAKMIAASKAMRS